MDEFATDEAFKRLEDIARLLCLKAIPDEYEDFYETFAGLSDFEVALENTTVQLKRERFPSEKGFNIVLQLTRGSRNTSAFSAEC